MKRSKHIHHECTSPAAGEAVHSHTNSTAHRVHWHRDQRPPPAPKALVRRDYRLRLGRVYDDGGRPSSKCNRYWHLAAHAIVIGMSGPAIRPSESVLTCTYHPSLPMPRYRQPSAFSRQPSAVRVRIPLGSRDTRRGHERPEPKPLRAWRQTRSDRIWSTNCHQSTMACGTFCGKQRQTSPALGTLEGGSSGPLIPGLWIDGSTLIPKPKLE